MTGGAAGPVRVAVIGCGAIGSLYAAHLARVPGVEVWAVDRWAEHVDAIESRGLRVTGLADFVAQVHARIDGRDLPACDFGLVSTKALHTRAAVDGARAALANAAVVSVQNGLGNEEVIAELVPRVIRGSIITAGAVAIAQAVAGAAALFDCGSGNLGARFGAADAVAALVVPPVLGIPGGLPVRDTGRVVAGLGVGGGDPFVCHEIAATALAAS